MAPVKKKLAPLGTTFLKEWREFNELNQDEAAARLDISRTLLSKIESGKSPYTQRHLEAAAAVYSCEPWELIAVNPNNPDSFWPLFKKAERLTGAVRDHTRAIIAAAVERPSERA